MKIYHRTNQVEAVAIKLGGFEDASVDYGFGLTSGVRVSDRPIDANEAKGDTLLLIDCSLSEADLQDYEVQEEGKPYREWLIPAFILNGYRTSITKVDE